MGRTWGGYNESVGFLETETVAVRLGAWVGVPVAATGAGAAAVHAAKAERSKRTRNEGVRMWGIFPHLGAKRDPLTPSLQNDTISNKCFSEVQAYVRPIHPFNRCDPASEAV